LTIVIDVYTTLQYKIATKIFIKRIIFYKTPRIGIFLKALYSVMRLSALVNVFAVFIAKTKRYKHII